MKLAVLGHIVDVEVWVVVSETTNPASDSVDRAIEGVYDSLEAAKDAKASCEASIKSHPRDRVVAWVEKW